MEKLAIKIPLLVFFLGVVYFASKGFDIMDTVMRAFMLAFGVALIVLVLTMVLMFFLTLQKSRAEDSKNPGGKESGKKVEMQV
ncbi:MAG: hypothetical protein M1470_05975 [Bacteroidetes bacterium]|nr:hypothetical protein [Bacteroidota bacterium]MCL5738257.1 hypothetical protein [Bacteroidota bacterium]